MGDKASDLLSTYFATEDVQKQGPFLLQVTNYEKAVFDKDGRQERKYALHVAGHTRRVLLNKENTRRFQDAFGDDLDGWIGKRFKLYFDENVYFGKTKKGGQRVEPLTDD